MGRCREASRQGRPVVRQRPQQRAGRDMTTDLPPQIRERTVAKARTLLEALPFMRAHGGRVIIVKYGGAAMETAVLASTFAEDVMLLQSVGIKPVIVHGGGPGGGAPVPPARRARAP